MVRISSSNSVNYSYNSDGPKKGGGPVKLGLTLRAEQGWGEDLNVGMKTSAKASGKQDLAVKTKAKSGKVDKLAVDVGMGDWADKPGDKDDIDFLILVSGAKGGHKAPVKPLKSFKGLDLRIDIDLKGEPLSAAFKPGTVEDLKLVKVFGPDGKASWGYSGTIDADARLVKLAFTSVESGAKVAELALNMHGAEDHHADDL